MWIDIARGIGIVAVLFGHLRLPYVVTWIYTFHMPLFFFLSGCVHRQTDSFKEFLHKKVKSVFIPYWVLGSVIWLFYATLNLFERTGKSLYGSDLEMLKNFIVQRGYWTIWFLACLFVCQIIFYLIVKVTKNRRVPLTMLSLLICTVAFIYARQAEQVLPWNIDVACVAQFFFCCGYIFTRSTKAQAFLLGQKDIIWLFWCVFLFVVNVSTGYLCIKTSGHSLDMSIGMYGNELLTVVSALAGTMFVILLASKLSWRPLVYLGQNTMILFAWHSRIVIVSLYMLYGYLGIFSEKNCLVQISRSIVTFALILLILIPVTEGLKKTKFHHLFGV